MSKVWFGSLQNRLGERSLQPVPEKDMGATMSMWSDRHAYTVNEISKQTVTVTYNVKGEGEVTRTYPKVIFATRDNAKLVSKTILSESQEYEFTPGDPENKEKFVFHKKSGVYRKASTKYVPGENGERGSYVTTNRTTQDATALLLGYKSEYYDPSF